MNNRYRIEVKAKAKPENIIRCGNFRITLLTEQLIRIEYSRCGVYVDLPTQIVWNRDFPGVKYHVYEEQEVTRIETESVVITCRNGGKEPEDIEIVRRGNSKEDCLHWHIGEQMETLKGTIRTLDAVDGRKDLDEGLLSERGITVLDDSRSYLITETGELQKRCEDGKDLYVFAYGHQYSQCLKDYFELTGKPPLLPRYALGNWWSRFHRYDEREYLELMDFFTQHNIPLTVAMIDMDWHLTNIDPKYGSGWTGYTWNRELFEKPDEFLKKLHERSLKVSLNVHPADGVRAFEEPYAAMVDAVGEELHVDGTKGEPVKFDVTNPVFLEAYFNYLHKPNEERGVDFWWVDWQQGETSDLPGLDPLWVLNHYHYLDNTGRDKRPMILSRYAGPGSHRYPIGFSGDTVISWESLAFQPYFTATASNIGYGWWSHDIGGHMLGTYDEELQIRWMQWGVFSPINRMHSTCCEFNHKEPWNYSMETDRIVSEYLRKRHQMIPYLYTMNWRSHKEGELLIQPMYYHYPENAEAYTVPNEYFFGTEMICLPITTPLNSQLQLAKVKGWLPEGLFVDWQRGTVYEGNRYLWFYRRLEEMPVLLKAGAIVVCSDLTRNNSTDNPDALEITVAAGADGEFTLYEDSGDGFAYRNGEYVYTKFKLDYTGDSAFCIEAGKGKRSLVPQKRQYKVRFLGFEMTGAILEMSDGGEREIPYKYQEEKNEITVWVGNCTEEVRLRFAGGMKVKRNNTEKLCFEVLDKARIPYELKEKIYGMIKETKNADRRKALEEMIEDKDLYSALTEVLEAQGE